MKKFIFGSLLFLALAACSNKGETSTQSYESSYISTGDWRTGSYVDDFGDKTGQEYLYINGNGEINAYVVELSPNEMYFVFKHLNDPYDDDEQLWIKYKDENGNISDWLKFPRRYNKGYAITGEGADKLKRLINNGEKVKFTGFTADEAVIKKGIKDTNFSFDFGHYKDAKSKVKW